MKFMFSKLEKAYFVSYSKDVILKASPDRKVRKNMERIIKKMDGSSVYTDLKPNEVKDVASFVHGCFSTVRIIYGKVSDASMASENFKCL